MSQDKRQQIEKLHALYIVLTGLDVRLDMARESVWFEWLRRGHTEQDLRDVVAHLRQGIRAGDRKPASLKFSNLINQVDYFEEDLAMARAQKRIPKKNFAREATLNSTGRNLVPDQSNTARSAGDILAGEKAFAQLRQLKGEL